MTTLVSGVTPATGITEIAQVVSLCRITSANCIESTCNVLACLKSTVSLQEYDFLYFANSLVLSVESANHPMEATSCLLQARNKETNKKKAF